MKLKIIILFQLLCGIAISQITTDSTNVKLESLKKFEENLNTVQTDIEKLNKIISDLDSLFNTNKVVVDGDINKLEKSISNQSQHFNDQINSLNKSIEKNNLELNNSLSSNTETINQNQSNAILQFDELKLNLDQKSKELDNAINEANALITKVNEERKNQIITLDNSISKTISKRSLYWLIAILLILIIIASIFFFLKSKVAQQQDSLSSVKDTQEKLENEAIQLYTKLIQILEQKLEVAQQQPQKTQEVDHSLPLKLGEEIHRMRKRLKLMDESQGTKVLNKRIESLEEKINDMGYEIVNLEGKPYDERMTLNVLNIIESDDLSLDEKIISRVIKPRVKYNGEIKQPGDVEVTQGIKEK